MLLHVKKKLQHQRPCIRYYAVLMIQHCTFPAWDMTIGYIDTTTGEESISLGLRSLGYSSSIRHETLLETVH